MGLVLLFPCNYCGVYSTKPCNCCELYSTKPCNCCGVYSTKPCNCCWLILLIPCSCCELSFTNPCNCYGHGFTSIQQTALLGSVGNLPFWDNLLTFLGFILSGPYLWLPYQELGFPLCLDLADGCAPSSAGCSRGWLATIGASYCLIAM